MCNCHYRIFGVVVFLFFVCLEIGLKANNLILFRNMNFGNVWEQWCVYSTVNDDDGFLWIGTNNGVYRYDGYKYVHYEQPFLIDNTINDLYFSTKGLLVGTNSGLLLYDKAQDSFVNIGFDRKKQTNNKIDKIRVIYQHGEMFYIGSNSGIYVMNNDFEVIRHLVFPGSEENENNDIVRAILADERGNLWFGTYDGLYKYCPNTGKLTFVETRSKSVSDPMNNLILSLEYTHENKNRLFVGRETGLTVLDMESMEFEVFRKETGCELSNNSIKTIKHLDGTMFLVGTDNGFNIFDYKTNIVKNYFHESENRYSIQDNVISDIHNDSINHYFWLSTKKGVTKLDFERRIDAKSVLYTKNSFYHNMSDMVYDKKGDIWIATSNGLLHIENDKIKRIYTIHDGLGHNNLNKLFLDSDNRLWVATMDGLNYIENNSVKSVVGLNKYIRGIHQTEDGTIWIISHLGLSNVKKVGYEYKAKQVLSLKSDIDNTIEIVTSKLLDNQIWMATNRGLLRYDIAEGKINIVNEDILYKNVTSMEVKDDLLLVGTNNGAYSYNIKRNELMRIPFVSSKQPIFDMKMDNDYLWVMSRRGLYRYSVTDDKCCFYDLLYDLPWQGEVPQCCYYCNGRLLLGGYGRYTIIDNKDINRQPNKARLRITDVMVNNDGSRCINVNAPVSLHYDDNFTISFALLNYPDNPYNKYAYRLVGYDNDWKFLMEGINSVTYSKIMPGEYRFEVKGCNADHMESPFVGELILHVDGPWWLKPWAYLLYLLCVVGMVSGILLFVKYRISVLELRQCERLNEENLKHLNNMRMQFFANVSHEFKTPLSLILGPVEVLSDKLGNDSQLASHLRILNKNVNRLRRLVEQIMSLCKLENNEMALNLQMGDLVQFVRNVYESFTIKAQEAQITLGFESEYESVAMMFDENKMDEVLYNLIDNAIKYTEPGGIVSISIKPDKDSLERVCIEISDTGVGIGADDLNKIFDKFYQGKHTSMTDMKGTGIGLNIVKHFVEMHSGQIAVKSKVAEGTLFRIALPIVCKYEKENEDALASDSAEGKLTLLIVEDNPDMREYLRVNLQEEYNIIEANDGAKGWEMTKIHVPDFIISDIVMPQMDGIEFCRKVKQEFQTDHIPIILLTALSEEMKMQEALEAGANSYITKPFSIKLLKLKISVILKDRKRLQEKHRMQALQQPTKVVQKETRDEKFVREFVGIVEKQMDNPDLDVDMLCSLLGYSHQQTYRKIHAITGKSINSFIRYIRINRAAQLLKETDMNLTEVMTAVGMSNRTYFSKIFKEEFGMSPTEYRGNDFS